MSYYTGETEKQMFDFYISLNEKDRRHYAAIEALKIGYGGITYCTELFLCSRSSIYKGIDEIENRNYLPEDKIRAPGGGRKSSMDAELDIDKIFLKAVEPHIAGDPMNKDIRWIKISRVEIGNQMKKLGIKVSKNIVKKLLKRHKFVKRKIQRKRSTGQSKDREQQFAIIEKKKKQYKSSKNPIISFDTKKKEHLGALHRQGSVYCSAALQAYDHDYSYLSEGKAVPHGIYDIKNNKAHINIGKENETAEFVCDSIKKWWVQEGKKDYSQASEIFALCDAGGANSYRHHIFKTELQKLVNQINIPIRISHYPPYSSKWNPIEHRVFPHVTRTMNGMSLTSVEEVKELISTTKTKTGLKVKVNIIKKTYKKGKKATKDLVEKIKIKRDKKLGYLNYMISPQTT